MNYQIFIGHPKSFSWELFCVSTHQILKFFINEFTKLNPDFFPVSKTNLSSLELKAHFI